MNPFLAAVDTAQGFGRKTYGRLASWPVLFGWGDGLESPQAQTRAAMAVSVYRAIMTIASRLASCPLIVEKRVGREKWERIDTESSEFGGVAGLFARCNREEGPARMWTRYHASRQCYGKVYLLTDYLNGGEIPNPGRSVPQELRAISGSLVEPVLSEDPRAYAPIGYRVLSPGGVPVTYRADEIIADLLPGYGSEQSALSPTSVARVMAMVENELSKHTYNYFRNGARAGNVFSTDAKLTEKELDRMEARFQQKHANGEGKSYLSIFTHSGMKWQEPSSRKDTDFPELFNIACEATGRAFGVPPVFMADFSDAALANIEEQTPILYEGTLMPSGRLTTDSLTAQSRRWDPRETIRFRYDWDSDPAVQRIREKRATAYVTLTGVPVWTPDEARAADGKPPFPNGAGKTPYIPFSMSPVGSDIAPRTPAVPGQANDSGAKHVVRRKWIDEPDRNAKRMRADRSMRRFEPSAERDIVTLLRAQEDRALKEFEKAVSGITKRTGGEPVFDEQFEIEQTARVIARIRSRIASVRGPEATTEVGGKSDGFLIDAPEVTRYIRDTAYESGKLITQTTVDKLRATITEGVRDGETSQQLTDRIRDVFQVRRHEAERIARTEVSRSYNFTTNEAWKQSGLVESTSWLTAHDDAVRSSHAAIDGQERGLGEPFDNGLLYPGDPDGDADEVINCRCTALPLTRAANDTPPDPTTEVPEPKGFRISRDLEALFAKRNGKVLTNGRALTERARS